MPSTNLNNKRYDEGVVYTLMLIIMAEKISIHLINLRVDWGGGGVGEIYSYQDNNFIEPVHLRK